ncbi:MAG: DnaJ domain-containing protein [Amnibacterium sp.]
MTGTPRPMSREDAAALLGVGPDATARVVRNAFLRAARRVHPDLHPEADAAERRAATERFDALVRARELLLSPAPAPTPAGPGGPAVARPAPPRVNTRPQERGFATSLVLIALLSFLIVALVTLDSALRGQDPPPGGGAPSTTSSPR